MFSESQNVWFQTSHDNDQAGLNVIPESERDNILAVRKCLMARGK